MEKVYRVFIGFGSLWNVMVLLERVPLLYMYPLTLRCDFLDLVINRAEH
jgi:hypothetical protein